MSNNPCEFSYWFSLCWTFGVIGYVIGMVLASVIARRAERKRLTGEYPPLP